MLLIAGDPCAAVWRAVAAGAAEVYLASEQDGWRPGGYAIGPGIMGDRPAAHRPAPSRAATRRRERESMPKTGDAEQAMRRFGLGDEDVAA